MSINLKDEIKQNRPFPSAGAEAFLSILRTATILEHEQNELLKPYRVTATQYNVLRILQGAGAEGLCGREIGERLIARVPDVSRLLDRMDELGMITRERDADDRRHVTARISDKGRAILSEATPVLQVIEKDRFRRVDPAAIDVLIHALADIRGPV